MEGRGEEGHSLMSLGKQTEHELPGLDSPLRLEQAVKLAFPFGGMTVSGLRLGARSNAAGLYPR
jgi:hypothetical protein